METKFKIGDKINYRDSVNWTKTIIDIVFEKKQTKYFAIEIDNCYVLIDERGHKTYLRFLDDHLYDLVSSSKNKSITTSSCPVCGGELKDKYSEYVGGNIKKCSKCGWC